MSTATRLGLASRPKSVDGLHFARLEKAGESRHEAIDDLLLALEPGCPVERRLPDLDTEFTRLGDGRKHLRSLEPRFGRNTSSQEAGSSNGVFLDEGNAQTEVVRIQSGGIATGAASHYYDVVHETSVRSFECGQASGSVVVKFLGFAWR